jgi:membrane protease YdiL (CAAX protease family)
MIAGAIAITVLGTSIVLFPFLRIKKNEKQGKKQKKIYVVIFSCILLGVGDISLFSIQVLLEKSYYVAALLLFATAIVAMTVSSVLSLDDGMKKKKSLAITLDSLGLMIILNLLALRGHKDISEIYRILLYGLWVPLLEEAVFRGYIYKTFFPDSMALKRRMLGFVIVSAIFTLGHMTEMPRASDILSLIGVFLMSMFCCTARQYMTTGKLGIPWFIHSAYNLMTYLLR